MLIDLIDKNATAVRNRLPEYERDEFDTVIETVKTMVDSGIDIDKIDNAISNRIFTGNISHATESAYLAVRIAFDEDENELFDKDTVSGMNETFLAFLFGGLLIMFAILIFHGI